MMPRMRPCSTSKSMLSNTTDSPKTLRSLCAAITGIPSAPLGMASRFGSAACVVEQVFYVEPEPLDRGADSGPIFSQEFLTLGLHQQRGCTRGDKHAPASLGLHQSFLHQLLIRLQHGQRIDTVLGGDIAHRGQEVALLENALEDHLNHAVAKLKINRPAVIPLTIHSLHPDPVLDRIDSYFFRRRSKCATTCPFPSGIM